MTTWKFYCEWKSNIPLPPDYTFARAFNYLNAEKNSFYILERDDGEFIQCGGSKAACTVEVKIFAPNHSLTHYVLGHSDGTDAKTEIQMSNGAVTVLQRQVLNHREAIRLFDCFFKREPFPAEYLLAPRNA
jgi:hypothetical protein